MSNEVPVSILTGLFFNGFDDEGRITLQGQILGRAEEDVYLTRLLSWETGEPSDLILLTMEEMIGFKFYTTPERMHQAYETYTLASAH